MTDELRSQRVDVDGSTAEGSIAAAGVRPRRRYTRPELTMFGTVKELTRGASGNARDTIGKKRKKGA